MLYLRTGANGTCKSLFTLKDLRDKQVAEGRPVCIIIGKPAVGGAGKETEPADPERRYLKIYPQTMRDFGWTERHYLDWWAQPDGTIFLADECHNYLPKRPNGSAVPDYVSKLGEHRSRGFDFFLLTQHPANVDSFVTKLIGAPGYHQHLKRVAGGSNVTSVLQWDAVNNQCEKNGSGRTAQVTMRTQPKEVYQWYQSAEIHTAKLRIPKQLWFLLASIPIVVALLGYVAHSLMTKAGMTGDKPKQDGTVIGTTGTQAQIPDKVLTPAQYVAAYQPRVQGLAYSAPIYDKLTEPKRVPVPAACVSMPSKGCKCYTQDATPYPAPDAVCRDFVAHGVFLAFSAEGEKRDIPTIERQSRQDPQQPLQQPSVIPDPKASLKDLGDAAKVAVSGASPQTRVPATSPWSFRTGG